MPLWAFRQLEDLKLVRHFVDWWIDNRQVPYGDFGGGISDDTDLLEQWPGLALMGEEPDRIRASHMRLADAAYKNGMFTNGLSTIVTDELHSYEDGINSNSEAMYIGWGDPKVVERLMTTVAALPRIITPNAAGHLHFKTNWFSGAKLFSEGPWEWQRDQSVLVMHPALLMGDFNADPTSRKYVLGSPTACWPTPGPTQGRDHLARRDQLAHRRGLGVLPPTTPAMQLLWGAYRLSGDAKYEQPMLAAALARAAPGRPPSSTRTGWMRRGKRAASSADAAKWRLRAPAPPTSTASAWPWQGQRATNASWRTSTPTKPASPTSTCNMHRPEGHWWSDRGEINSELPQRDPPGRCGPEAQLDLAGGDGQLALR